jgi:futalosine hydrolase
VVRGDRDYFNHFPLDRELVSRARQMLVGRSGAGIPAFRVGAFVTIQECTGTVELGIERASRFQAICENMEGAAGAHICLLFEVPFLELRGISNMVEDRQKAEWDIARAADAAQEAAWHLIEKLRT